MVRKLKCRFGSAIVLLSLAATSAHNVAAQDSQARTRDLVDASGYDLSDVGPGLAFKLDAAGHAHAPATPGDSELGDQVMLIPSGSYRPLTLLTQASGQWTSNAALTDTGELEDFYVQAEIGAAYVPRLTGNLYGEISAGYEFYRYTDHSRLDFDSLEARTGLIHVFRELGDLSAWARYNYNRLTSGRGHDELFTDHGIEIGFFKPLPIAARHSAYFSYISEFSLDANPGYSQYDRHSAILGYEWLTTDKLSLDSFYEGSFLSYHERGRDDFAQHFGLSLSYDITRTLSISIGGTYTINDSDIAGADYEAGTLGGTLGLKLKY